MNTAISEHRAKEKKRKDSMEVRGKLEFTLTNHVDLSLTCGEDEHRITGFTSQ